MRTQRHLTVIKWSQQVFNESKYTYTNLSSRAFLGGGLSYCGVVALLGRSCSVSLMSSVLRAAAICSRRASHTFSRGGGTPGAAPCFVEDFFELPSAALRSDAFRSPLLFAAAGGGFDQTLESRFSCSLLSFAESYKYIQMSNTKNCIDVT